MRPSIDSARIALPANSIAWPVPPAVPMRPMIASTTSFARHAARERPFDVHAHVLHLAASPGTAWRARARLRRCRCRARGSRTRRACWCASRRTPPSCPGSVAPCSGPMTCTMPWRLSRYGKYTLAPNSFMLASSVSICSCAIGSRTPSMPSFPVGGRRVVVGGGDHRVDAPGLAAGGAQAFVGLRAGHFMDEVAVDVEQRRAVVLDVHDVAVPELVVERLSHVSALRKHGILSYLPALRRPWPLCRAASPSARRPRRSLMRSSCERVRGEPLRRLAAARQLGHLLPQADRRAAGRSRRAPRARRRCGRLPFRAVREFGRLSVTSATMPAMLWPSSPMPNSAPAMPIAACVPIWREICSRECSRSACAISWPITAAISSSVAFSFWIRPVYMAILPPGMHQAFTSSIEMTCTSQAHFGGVGAEYGGLRDQPAGDGLHALPPAPRRWSSAFFFCASAIICAYAFFGAGVDLLRRDHHALLAVDADGAALGGVDGLATGQQRRRRRREQSATCAVIIEPLNVCEAIVLTAHSPARFKP